MFKWDGIHLNKKGYEIWKAVIKPLLLKDFPIHELYLSMRMSSNLLDDVCKMSDPQSRIYLFYLRRREEKLAKTNRIISSPYGRNAN